MKYLLPTKPTDCRAVQPVGGAEGTPDGHAHAGDDMAFLTCMVARAMRRHAPRVPAAESVAVLAGVQQQLAARLGIRSDVTGAADTQAEVGSIANSQVAMFGSSHTM